MVNKCKSIDTAAVLADLPERYSVSVPPVTNNICRAPLRLKTICRNGVPLRSGTTTALHMTTTLNTIKRTRDGNGSSIVTHDPCDPSHS